MGIDPADGAQDGSPPGPARCAPVLCDGRGEGEPTPPPLPARGGP